TDQARALVGTFLADQAVKKKAKSAGFLKNGLPRKPLIKRWILRRTPKESGASFKKVPLTRSSILVSLKKGRQA
ncbi:MAG: hypothetical protein EBZ49_16135, partial [Proteobacteria bacterium]|nr:hypothetical protein [Pseudomonadota bacterium]